MKILAGVLTYNRLTLLKRCLKYIKNQSLKPSNILVVDNGSNDGTKLYLEQNKDIIYISKNKDGSAAGWFEMIEYAIFNNYDYIWMMDDDGYPDHNSLENLSKNFNSKYVCLSSLVINENKKNSLVFPMPRLKTITKFGILNYLKIKKVHKLKKINQNRSIYNFCHLFNGSLISINAIKKIGNVNKDYYHHGVEVDFYLRLNKLGLIGSHLDSYHYHPDVTKRKINNLWIYYYIKNSMIINYKYMNLPLIRNFLVLIKFIIRLFLRNGISNALLTLTDLKNKIVFRAIIDGFYNKIGATYIEK